jgi:hypothetical protein
MGNLGHQLKRKERMKESIEQFNSEVSELADWIELICRNVTISPCERRAGEGGTNGAIEAYTDAKLSAGAKKKEAFKQRLNEDKKDEKTG